MLELKDVCLRFNKGSEDEKIALDHLNLVVNDGDFICILGTNGAGKSTLLNVISGISKIDSGQILLDGKDIANLPEHVRAKWIGRLFQDPLKGSAPSMSIEENLGLAYARGKKRSLSKAVTKEDRLLFKEALTSLDLGLEKRLKSEVGLLSGGQRQALTLLMATIVTPKLLLLDEHTAALDPKSAEKIMLKSADIINKNEITAMMITHNMKQALKYGNKTIILNEGKIVKELVGEERSKTTQEELIKMYDFV